MPIRGVADAIREMRGGSKHIKTRKQAIAVGLSQERKLKRGLLRRRSTGARR